MESTPLSPWRLLQQDFAGHKEGIEDKIGKMEEILEKLIAGMDVVMIDQASAWNEEMEGNDKENAKDVKPVY